MLDQYNSLKNDEPLLSLADFSEIFKRKKKTIGITTLIAILLFSFFALTRPVRYVAEASFRDKGTKQAETGLSLTSQLLVGLSSSHQSGAAALMRSYLLLEPLVEQFGLQGSLALKERSFIGLNSLQTIYDNLAITYAHLVGRKTPILIHRLSDLICRNLHYKGEVPLELEIAFISAEEFDVKDHKGLLIGKGTLGKPFVNKSFSFILMVNPYVEKKSLLQGKRYSFSVTPLRTVAAAVKKAISISIDKIDKSILRLEFQHSDRYVTEQFLNALMAEYQVYLGKESRKTALQELSYLQQREVDVASKLQSLLEKHAVAISSGFSTSGFADSERETEFLARYQQEFKQRLNSIDLEIKRLQSIQQEEYAYYDRYYSSGDADIINRIFNEIRLLKQQRNLLPRAAAEEKESEWSSDFEGITLEMAQELSKKTIHQIGEIEAAIRQRQFLAAQLPAPDFEVTSLGALLQDPISNAMIAKTSELVLAARDSNNRSEKELERINEELAVQKKFLAIHVAQTNHLHQIHQELLQQKLAAIQQMIFQLINRQMTLLKSQLGDYLQTRLHNLKQEKLLLQDQLQELHSQMAQLPQKWVSEQVLKQNLEFNKRMMDEITRLMEAKNVAHHLEVIQSAPIDEAIPPLLPKSPFLFLFAFLGASFGFCLSFGFAVAKAALQGVPVSAQNLLLARRHLSGVLTSNALEWQDPPSHGNLETLRRLIAYLCDNLSPGGIGRSLLLLQSEGPDYSHFLGKLLSKKKRKVLLIDLCMKASNLPVTGEKTALATAESHVSTLAPSSQLPPYLQEAGHFPLLQKKADFDFLPLGASDPYAIELLTSRQFQRLIAELKTQYDDIIAFSNMGARSAVAEQLLALFDSAAVTIAGETVKEIDCLASLSDPNKKISFLFTSPKKA